MVRKHATTPSARCVLSFRALVLPRFHQFSFAKTTFAAADFGLFWAVLEDINRRVTCNMVRNALASLSPHPPSQLQSFCLSARHLLFNCYLIRTLQVFFNHGVTSIGDHPLVPSQWCRRRTLILSVWLNR